MDRSRTLRLRRETLTALDTDELALVVGAVPPEPTPPVWAVTYNGCPTQYCVPLTDACPSLLC